MTTARIASIASWIVPPIGMAIAYSVLAITSGTDNTGKAWMAIGFAFVLVTWFTLRILIESTTLARAVAAGDADRILAICEKQLRRHAGDARRARWLIYRALAYDLRGEWVAARTAIDAAKPSAIRGLTRKTWEFLSAAVRVGLDAETGELARARAVLDRELEPLAEEIDHHLHTTAYLIANLSRGRLLYAEGDHTGALAMLQRVIDDIRAGSGMRATAHAYAARAAEASGDAAAASKHRAAEQRLVPKAR